MSSNSELIMYESDSLNLIYRIIYTSFWIRSISSSVNLVSLIVKECLVFIFFVRGFILLWSYDIYMTLLEENVEICIKKISLNSTYWIELYTLLLLCIVCFIFDFLLAIAIQNILCCAYNLIIQKYVSLVQLVNNTLTICDKLSNDVTFIYLAQMSHSIWLFDPINKCVLFVKVFIWMCFVCQSFHLNVLSGFWWIIIDIFI